MLNQKPTTSVIYEQADSYFNKYYILIMYNN